MIVTVIMTQSNCMTAAATKKPLRFMYYYLGEKEHSKKINITKSQWEISV